jgi:signal transduction histidine kinase
MTVTLRTKGILSFAVIVLYVMVVTLWVTHERLKLLHVVDQLEIVRAKQELLVRLNLALGHSITEIQNTLKMPTGTENVENVSSSVQLVVAALGEFQPIYPALLTDDLKNLHAKMMSFEDKAGGDPMLKMLAVRDSELRLIEKLNEITTVLNAKSNELSTLYRTQSDAAPLIGIGLYMAGLSVYGLVIFMFFKRLATDINRLEQRAMAVATGYRGAPLRVTRRDEVGGLMEAVNRMQETLLRSEERQEYTRQRQFHQEKMAAVGSLASAIAHEVSNPMAAISGITQEIIAHTTPPPGLQVDRRRDHRLMHDQAQMILQHTERIAAILRRMSTLTDSGSQLPELLDLNALVRNTSSFIGYDKRFRNIQFELDLDPAIPAINAVSDHITQILMNLLINAADAMSEQSAEKPAQIRISTREVDGHVHLTVTDTGHGMSPELLAQAFTKHFTTKPVGVGRGIGLSLCKKLVEEGGGSITLESSPEVGTTARLILPLLHPLAPTS